MFSILVILAKSYLEIAKRREEIQLDSSRYLELLLILRKDFADHSHSNKNKKKG